MAPESHTRQQPHFIIFPLMAQGHMIPAVDMARLFAQRGVIVTIVTTPLNALRFKTTTDRAIHSGLPLRILQLRFPSEEAGIPEGCENADSLPSMDVVNNFFAATLMLQHPLEQAIQEMEPTPNCIISDSFLPWTNETATKFDIPRIIFHSTSCFYLMCANNIPLHKPRVSETEPFVIPGMPDRIEMTKNCLPLVLSDSDPLHRQITTEGELAAYGAVVNSFEALETRYAEGYRKVKGNKAWCIGPVSLCNTDVLDKAERGKQTSIDSQDCLKWLDSKTPNSVVYVCLGSMSPVSSSQLIQIGLGLEASGCPFVWVIKGNNQSYQDFKKWSLEKRYEERTKDRGLIIKGWAPQVLILSHQAIGAFVTHCGWNSTLEGVCAGVPFITWPMFAEQFLNEKLIVQVLGIGVGVGANAPVPCITDGKTMALVTKEEIEKAVNTVMDDGEEGEMMRRKAGELGVMAKQAMEEGGSSHLNMSLFIEDIMSHSC